MSNSRERRTGSPRGVDVASQEKKVRAGPESTFGGGGGGWGGIVTNEVCRYLGEGNGKKEARMVVVVVWWWKRGGQREREWGGVIPYRGLDVRHFIGQISNDAASRFTARGVWG